MATSGPPPLCGASESYDSCSCRFRLMNDVAKKIQLHMWSFGSCASSKILRGRFRLILKVMTSFAHQVLVFTPWFVITFVTLPGKCQWFCRCALPPGVSGSSRDTSCKRKCSSSEADHKGDVVIEPWERGVADVADKEDAVVRLQDIKLLKIIHYPPGRIFQMSGIKHVNQFPHKNFLPWVCWNHGWDNGAVPFRCPPSITKIIIVLENSTIPPWKCMEQTGESGQQHLEDPPVEATHHTTVHLWWEFTLVTIFKSSPSPCIFEYAGANLNCVPFPWQGNPLPNIPHQCFSIQSQPTSPPSSSLPSAASPPSSKSFILAASLQKVLFRVQIVLFIFSRVYIGWVNLTCSVFHHAAKYI